MASNDVPASIEPSWFYREGGNQKGPVTLDEIVSAFKAGGISGETLVWNAKSPKAEWVQLKTVEEFLRRDGVLLVPAPPQTIGDMLKSIGWLLLSCFSIIFILNKIDSPILNSLAIYVIVIGAVVLFWGMVFRGVIRGIRDIWKE